MIVKKILAAMCAATMVVTVTSCGNGSNAQSESNNSGSASTEQTNGTSPQSADGGITIGMVVNNAGADTYQTTYYSTAESYAKELGIQLRLLDPVGDVTKQQNQVQDLISMGCDAIVVWPVNSEAAVSYVKAISEAGIPVLTANTNVDESGEQYLECYVGPSNIEEGRQSAEVMVQEVGKDAKIVYIDGQIGYSTSNERKAGMLLGIEGTNIQLLEEQPGEAKRERAQQVMENFLVKYAKGELDAVFCYDDTTAIGAINAIEAIGRDEIKVYAAACGDYNTLDIIRSGKLAGVAMQSPITDAKTAMDFAVRVAQGEKIPEFYNYIETPVATPANIESLNIEPW